MRPAQLRSDESYDRLHIEDLPEDLGKALQIVWARAKLTMNKATALSLGT